VVQARSGLTLTSAPRAGPYLSGGNRSLAVLADGDFEEYVQAFHMSPPDPASPAPGLLHLLMTLATGSPIRESRFAPRLACPAARRPVDRLCVSWIVPQNGQFQSVCFQLDHTNQPPLSGGPGTVLLDPCTQKAGPCFSTSITARPCIRSTAPWCFGAPATFG